MSCNCVWGFLKRKLGLSVEPSRDNSNVNNCTQEPPPSSTSATYNPDPAVTPSPSLKPKRCRVDGPVVTSLPSESIEPFAALCQLLTCSVCLEISHQANQCANGHLICLACSAQLEQSAFTAGRACSCPVCRVSLSRWESGTLNGGDDYGGVSPSGGTPPGLQRCLLAERLAAELPTACKFCNLNFPRRTIDRHRSYLCEHRPVACPYSWLGCGWIGSAGNLSVHLTRGCRLMEREKAQPWMRLAAKRMQSVGERTTARLQPWRGLLRLLQNRQHVHFGVRGLAGLRVIHLPVVMTRLRRSGRNGNSENSCEAESNTYSSSVLCLPTGGKSSIWVQFELSSKSVVENATEDQSGCEVAVEATYRVEFRRCGRRPNMRRPVDRERIFTSNLIFYTLTSFKSETAQELEVFDRWHGLNEPERSVDGESSSGGHTVIFRPIDADALLRFPENLNSAEVDHNSLPCIEPVNAEVIFGRDTFNCFFLLALDPKLFTQERVVERSRTVAAASTPNNSSQPVVGPHVELVLRTGAGDDEGEEEEEDDEDDDEDDDMDEDDEEEDDEEEEEAVAEGQAAAEDPARNLLSLTTARSQETETETNENSIAHASDSRNADSLPEQTVALRASARRRRARETT